MHFVQNPPDAAALMTTARSFGNYDLPSALADLIDNSIKAESHNIRLSCLYNGGDPQVSVVDDGYGMTAASCASQCGQPAPIPLQIVHPMILAASDGV